MFSTRLFDCSHRPEVSLSIIVKCNVSQLGLSDRYWKWKITFNQYDLFLLQYFSDFSVIKTEVRVLVTAFECSVNLVKSREGNTNSQTISSVVCCVLANGIYRDLGTSNCVGSNREIPNSTSAVQRYVTMTWERLTVITNQILWSSENERHKWFHFLSGTLRLLL